MRRRGSPGLGTGSAIEELGHCFRVARATADLDEGANNRPNHVTQEPVSRNLIRQNALTITPVGSGDRADGPVRLTAGALKSSEIVSTDKRAGRPFHCRQIERLGKKPGVGAVEGIRYGSISDSILVSLRPGTETGVEAGIDLGNRQDSDFRRKLRVERPLQRGHIVIEAHDDACHLPERVNACGGASGAVHRQMRALESRQRLLEHTLDGLPFRLTLPADEARPVGGEGALEGAQILPRGVLKCSVGLVPLCALRLSLRAPEPGRGVDPPDGYARDPGLTTG